MNGKKFTGSIKTTSFYQFQIQLTLRWQHHFLWHWPLAIDGVPKKFTPDSAHAVHVSSAGIEKSQSSQTIPLCKSLSVVPRPLWKFWPWYPKDPLPFLNFLSIFLSSVLWLKIQKKVLRIGQIYIKK